MSPVGTRPSGSSAAASEPGDTVHGARTAARSRAGEAIEPARRRRLGARPRRAEPGPLRDPASPSGDSGSRLPRRTMSTGGIPARSRAVTIEPADVPDDEVGAPGVPAELGAERGQHAGVERVADGAARSEDEGDAGHGASLAAAMSSPGADSSTSMANAPTTELDARYGDDGRRTDRLGRRRGPPRRRPSCTG